MLEAAYVIRFGSWRQEESLPWYDVKLLVSRCLLVMFGLYTFWSCETDNTVLLRVFNPNHPPYEIRFQLALIILNKCVWNPISATLIKCHRSIMTFCLNCWDITAFDLATNVLYILGYIKRIEKNIYNARRVLFQRRIILKVTTLYVYGSQIVKRPRPHSQFYIVSSNGCSIWNLSSISFAVTVKICLNILMAV